MSPLQRKLLTWSAVVIVFVIMLVVLSMPYVINGQGLREGQSVNCGAFISQLEVSLKLYQLDTGNYPPSGAEGLAVLITARSPKGLAYYEFKGSQLVNGRIVDNWGQPFVYHNNEHDSRIGRLRPNAHNTKSIDLYSIGPNGIDELGGGDDIKNWD